MSAWFPADPAYGRLDDTPEALAAEDLDLKGRRILAFVRDFVAQSEYPFAAFTMDGHELVMMPLAHYQTFVEAAAYICSLGDTLGDVEL